MAEFLQSQDSLVLQGGHRAFEVLAPAKLNFYLHILGRRLNGYHDLSSLVGFASVGDTVHIAEAEAFSFRVTGPMAAPELDGVDNLCVRAALDLAAILDRAPNIAITLVKRLPIASGVGGGSADAAAVLRILEKMWAIDPAQVDLPALALSLGADVPVCLAGVPAEMYGIGEDIRPVEAFPPTAVVLVNPGVAVSTAAVFKDWQGPGPDVPPWTAVSSAATFAASLMKRRNELTAVAKQQAPEVAKVLAALTARPDCLLARMSGSGATCFGLFESVAVARAAADVLAMTHPDWWVRSGEILSQPPVVQVANVQGPLDTI